MLTMLTPRRAIFKGFYTVDSPSPMQQALESGQSICVIGLMSGTSLDGIDAAFVKTDGHRIEALGPSITLPYTLEFQQRLRGVIHPDTPAEQIFPIEQELTQQHAQAVEILQAQHPHLQAMLIGFHGHTLWHCPPLREVPVHHIKNDQLRSQPGATCQIGDGALLARLTGFPVVYDFRSHDVHQGGEGAPLVPIFHAALCRNLSQSAVIVNIGGVANLTFVPQRAHQDPEFLLAFDTGPGNALINDWLLHRKGLPYDPEGTFAAAGRVHADLLASCLAHPALALRPPRSFDRDTFKLDAQQQIILNGLSLEDGAATLTAFTAQTIADAAKFLPEVPQLWFVSGGGRHNPTLMQKLDAALQFHDPRCRVQPLEALGVDGDACEAYAFAFLAARCVLGLPISFPGTTCAPQQRSGGKLAYPEI